MGWMVADSKLLLDQSGHAAAGPDRTKKAMGFGTLLEQFDQLRELARTQRWRATRSRMISQRWGAVAGSARQPLTDRALGHPQSRSDARLGPSLLMQFPGAAAATLAPTEGPIAICCVHNP